MQYLWWGLTIIFILAGIVFLIGIFKPDIFNRNLKEGEDLWGRTKASWSFVVCLLCSLILISLATHNSLLLTGIGTLCFLGMIVFLVMAYKARKNKTGKFKKLLKYAGICFLVNVIFLSVNNAIYPAPKEDLAKSKQDTNSPVNTTVSAPVDTSSNTNTDSSNVADTATVQKGADAKQNQVDAQKAADDQAKKAQVASDAKATQQAELQALGDWSIKSNSDDFSKRYTDIQNKIAAGDRQSAYDEATMASKRADDLNSKTMNNQDMDNVPKDIPSNVRDILSGVDYLLATGYMSEKQGFDALADGINTNDLKKLDDMKTDFAVANDQFNQAKALIDKANAALK